MKRFLAVLTLGLLLSAQAPVITQPSGVTTYNNSGVVTAGGTYQQVFPAYAPVAPGGGRKACTIINLATTTLYVFAGPIASAVHTNSVPLAQFQSFYCGTAAGSVLQDQISVDGTTSGGYYAAQQ